VTEMLDVLGLGRVDVLGYSFGGGLAQELAYRAPERVRRLVLCATAPGLGGSPPRPMAALMLASPARYYHPRLLELSVAHIAGGRTAREPGALDRQAAERLLHPPSPIGYAYQLYAVAGWSSLPWLRRVRHPTLVVSGVATFAVSAVYETGAVSTAAAAIGAEPVARGVRSGPDAELRF